MIARLRKILAARKRNETSGLPKHWRPAAARTKGGVMEDRDWAIWIDWLVKDGQLANGQLEPRNAYTNELNPYAK